MKDGAGLQALLPSASGAADILPGGQPPLSISASATLVRRRPAHACEEIYAVVVGEKQISERGRRARRDGNHGVAQDMQEEGALVETPPMGAPLLPTARSKAAGGLSNGAWR